jgi:lipoyl(octanoyl) transferase
LPSTSNRDGDYNSLNQILTSNIGRTRYADAWQIQQKLWEQRHAGFVGDLLLFTEHEPVYTIGKGGDFNHLLADGNELQQSGVEVYHIDRGGDVTYHGPGQIVGYPILDLNNYFLDLHRYLRSLEEVMIEALADFGIRAGREEGLTGVWVNGDKIGALGVKVSRWVTMHGFALNVNTDLKRFDRIIPCGIFHKGVTSLQSILQHEVDMMEVRSSLARAFGKVFTVEMSSISKDELLTQTLEPLSKSSESTWPRR